MALEDASAGLQRHKRAVNSLSKLCSLFSHTEARMHRCEVGP